jgi:hypothetical protein
LKVRVENEHSIFHISMAIKVGITEERDTIWIAKEDRPAIPYVIVELNSALCCIGLEIRSHASQAEWLNWLGDLKGHFA